MKKLLLSLSVFISLLLNAQAPQGFNYQASIRDASNNIVANQSVSVRITLIQGSLTGTSVYQETFTDSTSSFGAVSLVIGTGSVVWGSFSGIDWGNGPYFIETAVDVNGGTSYQTMGAQQLMSVPYALHATSVEEKQTLDISNDTLSISDGNTVVLPTSGDKNYLVLAKPFAILFDDPPLSFNTNISCQTLSKTAIDFQQIRS